MIGIIESAIGAVSPRWAAHRAHWRAKSELITAAASDHKEMRKMMGGSRSGGYEAGKVNRLTQHNQGSGHENDLPRDQIKNMRFRSYNLYRNNPQARKILRTLCAKVVGRGLKPSPQVKQDGRPFVDFRRRAREIWAEFSKEADFRGKPGKGGQDLVTLHKTALKEIARGGSVFVRFHRLNTSEQKKADLLLPLQVQLIHSDRLDEEENGDGQFYGVDLDAFNRPKSYRILKGSGSGSETVDKDDLIHLFAEEDIDQLIGSPWFGAALLTMDDRRHYETSELTAAEMSSCFVAGYRRASGQTGALGLPNPEDTDRDLTDADGNTISYLQPGMFLDLGATGEIELLNPSRPNSSADAFLNYLMRSEAVSMPGVKSSTITGDYRLSSFSSERSADNDIWPEIEEIQDWLATGFSQPVYEEVIKVAVSEGLFNDIEGFSVAVFNRDRRNFLRVNWQGPVARSINPKDDAEAARLRVQNANSSPQREAAQLGRDWQEILREQKEFIDFAVELEIPEDIYLQGLGIMQQDTANDNEEDDDDNGDNGASKAAIAAVTASRFAPVNQA